MVCLLSYNIIISKQMNSSPEKEKLKGIMILSDKGEFPSTRKVGKNHILRERVKNIQRGGAHIF